MCLSRYTLTYQVNAMTNIIQIVYTRNLNYMSLVIYKIRISFDSSFYSLEVCTFFQFHINHTAMNTCSNWNCHRQCIFHASNSTYSYRVSHTTSRTKVCISNTFRSNSLQQSTNYRITSRIPSCRNDRYSVVSFCCFTQRTAQAGNLSVDVEAVYRVDA